MRQIRSTSPAPYWNPYAAGVALGCVLFTSLLLTGNGLGASGGVARMLAGTVDVVAPRYVDTNPYLGNLAGGDANPWPHRMTWMVVGVVAGGAVSSVLAGRWKREIIHGPRVKPAARLAWAVAGGALMGWGAALARGCTSGQALSGGAVLSAGSWAFMMMVFAGGYLLAYPMRRLWT